MPARVVVLGGGVGGTLAANLLARQLGRDVHVTVVDPTGMHVYQPGFLYAALGRANGRWLARDERTLLRREVELAVEGATLVEPDKGLVRLAHGGSLPFDYLLLATGARLVPDQIPGLVQAAHEFYSLQGALRLREALRGFKGGRVLVGVAGIPYKCPPAPVEFTLMLDQYLRQRGVRGKSQVTLLSPLNRAFTIESASKLVQPIMQRRGIGLETFFNVETVDPSAATVSSLEGDKADYGGRVMCFLETGDGRATALRFDYQHPPVPPAPSRFWHAAKWAFNRLYWDTVPQGRIPERRAATHDSQRRPA